MVYAVILIVVLFLGKCNLIVYAVISIVVRLV